MARGETRDALNFFLELLMHLIDRQRWDYVLPGIDMPVDLAAYPIRVVRYRKLLEVISAEATHDDLGLGALLLTLNDTRTRRSYSVQVSSLADGGGSRIRIQAVARSRRRSAV